MLHVHVGTATTYPHAKPIFQTLPVGYCCPAGMSTRMPSLVTRTPTTVVRRSMATEPMELPKLSGAIWMGGGVAFFFLTAAWVGHFVIFL